MFRRIVPLYYDEADLVSVQVNDNFPRVSAEIR
jgi:hypothetical protein